jgi:hypothetical protein
MACAGGCKCARRGHVAQQLLRLGLILARCYLLFLAHAYVELRIIA